jgi:hypothetical protein
LKSWKKGGGEMEKNWFGFSKNKKGTKLEASRRASRVKADGIDRFSNVIVVEWRGNQERPFSAMRRYLKSWGRLLKLEDKEKKS